MIQQKIENKLPVSLIWIGIFIALFCISIFFIISWLLEYKDTIEGRILITTPAMPIDIHAQATGRLQLLKPNKIMVREGDHLAYIENAAHLQSCLYLLNNAKSAPFQNPSPSKNPSLYKYQITY